MSTSFGERARQAVVWNTAFALFRNGLQFCVMLILVRLLEPAAYGQFALATSIIGFVSLVSFTSSLEHSLQARSDADVDYQLHFTAGGFFQIGCFLLANLVALVAGRFPTWAAAAPLVHGMSFIFLLSWPQELRQKMLERAFDWRRMRLLQAIGLLFIALASLLMALAGAGAYALALPGLLMTVPFIYDLFVVQGWRPDWRFAGRRYLPALRFGLAELPNALAVRLRPLLEQGLIVSLFGYASVGFLNRANGLAGMFCAGPAAELLVAIYPVMTRIERGTPQYRRMCALVIRTVVWAAVPVALLFAVLARPVVAVVYGEQWMAVVPLLPWTMLGALLTALQQTLLRLMMAHDQIRALFFANLLWLGGMALCLALVLRPYGLIAYLASLCAVQAGMVLFLATGLQQARGLNLADLGHALGTALLTAGLALGVTWTGFALIGLDHETWYGAVPFGCTVALLYLAGLRLLFAGPLDEILGYLPQGMRLRRFLLLS